MSSGLKALKYLKENKRKHWLENDKSSESLDTIEKELKVLEIILRLPIKLIPETDEEFGELACGWSRVIIDEKYEYYLLKEVLKWKD